MFYESQVNKMISGLLLLTGAMLQDVTGLTDSERLLLHCLPSRFQSQTK